MQYSTLTTPQLLDVLRTTHVAYLAVCADDQPYAAPVYYELDADGAVPLIRIQTGSGSLKAEFLRRNPQVCLCFSLMGCAWIDSVTLLGAALLCEDEDSLSVTITVRAVELSGRRYYLE